MISKLGDRLKKEDIIKLDRIERMDLEEDFWGLYKFSYNGSSFLSNYNDLIKEVNRYAPGKGQYAINRLMEFPIVYIIIPTGEVFVDAPSLE